MLLCDFHKEQAWLRWTSQSRNGVDPAHKEQLLGMLRAISHADTVDSYAKAVESLKQSSTWKSNTALQQWFTRRWLTHSKASLYSVLPCNVASSSDAT